ncbi:MAG: efflux RND transporter permease subunit [Myxococcaceae bacterium]|nr:efflux RND transporter permease subunit [Myxococcaceae bacterium]
MTLSDLSIKRPVFTTMMSLALLVLGLLGLSRLGTNLFPDVSFPFVAITTVYRGAGPSEIEQQVTKPLEDAVAGIGGVDSIQSITRENLSLVFVQFKLSVPLDRAVQEVRDKVAVVQQVLPRDVDAPKVARIDFGAAPIVTYAVSATLPSAQLRQLLKDKLEPALSQVDGVAQVRIIGGDVREIRVDIDLDKAKAAGIAPAQIAERIGMENVDVPAGRLDLGPAELNVRSLGQFKDVDELRALPIVRNQTGTQVRLDEVATVTDGVGDRRSVARLNGKDAVVVEVIKQPGSNTIEVSHAVQAKMSELTPVMGNGFEPSLIIDNSKVIEENTHEVWVALLFGGLMAIVIILLFLLDVRGTTISALALPTSVLGTFFTMYLLGYTLNQMTLMALSLAIGLLIDDAVVVREAITHRLEQGETPRDAASNGTRDVYLAVLATTLSLVAVFVPVAFMPGIVGQFFKEFGFTMSVAVLISLFISFTLDPMLSSRFSKQRLKGEAHRENVVARTLRRSFEWMEARYGDLLGWSIRHRWLTAGLVLATMGGAIGAAAVGGLGVDFVSPEDRSQFMVDLKLPEGTSLAETKARAIAAEEVMRTYPDVIDMYTVVGTSSDGAGSDANRARIRVIIKGRDQRQLTLAGIQNDVRTSLVAALPSSTEVGLLDPPVIEGLGDFFPIMLSVMGNDYQQITAEAQRVAAIMRDFRGPNGKPLANDVRVAANPPRPELAVVIDRSRANDTGLTSGMLGMQLRLAMNGQLAGKLRQEGVETDIMVRLSEKDRASPEALRTMDVFTPTGLRPISDVAEVSMRDTPSIIERFNRQRRVMVQAAGVGEGGALGDLATALKTRLAKEPPPPGVTYYYDGQIKSLDEQNDAFGLVFALAGIFVYMVLASQFESFKHPFTILMSVPLAFVGAVLALLASGFNANMGAFIGVVLLMGLVTKNAILLVDQVLQNLRAGDDLDTAILKAGPRRLRPILMTSAAMAIGMVPTAVGRGQGFEFRAPMAITVIGGVISSTFLTLVVVPLIFAAFEKLTPPKWRIGKDAATKAPPEPAPHVTPVPGIAARTTEPDAAQPAVRPV